MEKAGSDFVRFFGDFSGDCACCAAPESGAASADLALKAAAELSRTYLPIELQAAGSLDCEQFTANRECLGPTCPLHP